MSRRAAVMVASILIAAACQGGAETPTTAATTTAQDDSTLPTSSTSEGATTTVAPTATAAAPDAVDLILTGGPVVTMDPAVGTVEAIAIDGDTIVAVGSAYQIAQYAGADTVVVDLAGRTIIPGFVDAHTHVLFEMGGLAEGQRLALENGITTVGDAYVNAERVDAYVAAAESGELRVGRTCTWSARMPVAPTRDSGTRSIRQMRLSATGCGSPASRSSPTGVPAAHSEQVNPSSRVSRSRRLSTTWIPSAHTSGTLTMPDTRSSFTPRATWPSPMSRTPTLRSSPVMRASFTNPSV